jgi:hypothetical protein
MIYSDRPTAAADLGCLAAFGGDPRDCKPIVARLQEIFPTRGSPSAAGTQDVCRSLSVDVIVAKDTDSAWRDPASWVWKESPVYANRYVRLFSCPVRTAQR